MVATIFHSVLSEYFSCFRKRNKMTAKFMTKQRTCPPYPLHLCEQLIIELIINNPVRNTVKYYESSDLSNSYIYISSNRQLLGEVYSRYTSLGVHAAHWNQLQQSEVSPKVKLFCHFIPAMESAAQKLENIPKLAKKLMCAQSSTTEAAIEQLTVLYSQLLLSQDFTWSTDKYLKSKIRYSYTSSAYKIPKIKRSAKSLRSKKTRRNRT